MKDWRSRQFGRVVRRMKALGYSRAEIGAMEVWEIASALGVGEPEPSTEDPDMPTAPRPAMAAAARVERNRARVEGRPIESAAPDLGAFSQFLGG
jgi:hypothetical protein